MNSAKTNTRCQSGFTLVELLIGMTVAGLLTTAIVPSVTHLMYNNQIKSAQENVAQALRKAKHVARSNNTSIRVIFTKDSSTFELQHPNNSVLQTVSMPNVQADTTITFRFNSTGTVSQTGTITLKSSNDTSKTADINIDSLFGHISIG